MDERSGTIRLVEPAQDSEARGLVATVSRTDVEQAMRSEGSVDLLLDVERVTSDDDGRGRDLAHVRQGRTRAPAGRRRGSTWDAGDTRGAHGRRGNGRGRRRIGVGVARD